MATHLGHVKNKTGVVKYSFWLIDSSESITDIVKPRRLFTFSIKSFTKLSIESTLVKVIAL